MNSSDTNGRKPSILREIFVGVVIAVIGGVIVAYLIQDARFALSVRTTLQTKQPSQQVEVFADKDWQDTGIYVQSGQALQINYLRGEWSQCPKYGCPYFTADGEDFETPADNILSGCRDGALIGHISGGEAFCVRSKFNGQASESGNIELRINDEVISDNGGSVTIEIKVGK